MTIFYACTFCGEETACDVRLRYQDSGLPAVCPHCEKEFTDNDNDRVLERAEEKAREPLPDDVI